MSRGCVLVVLFAVGVCATPLTTPNTDLSQLTVKEHSECVQSTECGDEGFGMCHSRGKCCQGKCVCNTGYSGDNCETSTFSKCPKFCYGNAVACVDGNCICKTGFGGIHCSETIECADLAFCNNHGLCLDGACVCDHGYLGPDCSAPVLCPNSCSGNGICNSTTFECKCFPGFEGSDCSKATPNHCPHSCSASGSCRSDGMCKCHIGMIGSSCDTAIDHTHCRHGTPVLDEVSFTFSCQCQDGWTGTFCTEVDLTAAPCASIQFCSGKGICTQRNFNTTSGSSAMYGCDCGEGYGLNRDCSRVEFSACDKGCSGHGVCNDVNSRCKCADGWTGTDCSKSLCPHVSGSVCSSHGICDRDTSSSSNSTQYHCTCDDTYSNDDCSTHTAPSVPAPVVCPNECSGNGVCVNDVCDCFESWFGAACDEQSLPDTAASPAEFA